MHGSNLGTKYDLYLEAARFAARHKMRPFWNSLHSQSALPCQCTHGNLKLTNVTPFYIPSSSLFNIILSLNTLMEGDHILATNVGQPPQNFRRQKGDTRQSDVQYIRSNKTNYFSQRSQLYFSVSKCDIPLVFSNQYIYSDTSANEDNSFRNHIR